MFKPTEDPKFDKRVAKLDKNLQKELNNHRSIKLTLKDEICLFFSEQIGSLFFCKFKKKDKLQKLYQIGSEKIESSLDMVKIIRNLRNLEILFKNSILTPEFKKLLEHSKKNVINLDDEEQIDYNSIDQEQTEQNSKTERLQDVFNMSEIIT